MSSFSKEVFPYTVKDFKEPLFLKSLTSCLLLAINFLKFLRFFKEDSFNSDESYWQSTNSTVSRPVNVAKASTPFCSKKILYNLTSLTLVDPLIDTNSSLLLTVTEVAVVLDLVVLVVLVLVVVFLVVLVLVEVFLVLLVLVEVFLVVVFLVEVFSGEKDLG